jgi:hypothetical protein
MNTRPAWGVLLGGAVLVLGLILSPIWLEEFSDYFEEEAVTRPFPDAFYELPTEAQDIYSGLYASNPQMAIDMVAARLAEPVVIKEPNLPIIDPNPQLVEEVLTGNFVTLDAVRRAEGTAIVFRLSSGRVVVRLQDLAAIGGPDLHVLLTAFPRPATREELDQVAQYEIDLGPLKGTQGNQNYPVEEPTFNIENYTEGSVVIYSTRYDLVFSFAPLAPP